MKARHVLGLFLVVMSLGLGCSDDATAWEVEWYWDHPESGSDVVGYLFQISVEDTVSFSTVTVVNDIFDPSEQQTLVYDMPENGTCYVRVIAVDDRGRYSDPSRISEPYTDHGKPTWGSTASIGWRMVAR